MYFRFILLMIFLSFATLINAQGNKTLFSVDKNKVSLDEFKSAFAAKYGEDKMSDKKLVNDFLEEYVNFKLRVEEAKALKLNKDESIKKQVDDFSKVVAYSNIVDKSLVESLAREAYNRMKTEVNLLHILFRVSQYAVPEDTILAYNKALEVRKLLIGGADFSEIATQVSDDPLVATNKGNLGYVSVFRLPYEVENYIYNSSSAEYSNPIRSEKGYHIVKILGKRKNPGYFKISHILVKNDIDTSKIHDTKTKKEIDEAYKEFLNGENFNILVQKYSNDISCGKKSNTLPWLCTGLMPAEIEKNCVKLQSGGVSKPIKTRFGWHIIRNVEHQDLPEYNLIKDQIIKSILKNDRGNAAKNITLNKLKKKYKYVNYKKLDPINKMVDSTIFEGNWIAEGFDVFTDKIFKINNVEYSQKDFIKYLLNTQKITFPIPIETYIYLKYNQLVDSILLNNELNYLINNNAEISNFINNYEEMLLVNKLEANKPNIEVLPDESELRKYYDEHKEKYNSGYELDMSIFSYTSNIKKIEKQFKKLKKKHASDLEIETRIKSVADMKFKLDERVKAQEGQNLYINHIVELFKKGKLGFDDKLIIFATQKKLVWLNSHMRKTDKSFEEVKEQVANDYEEKNQNKWLKHIKRKHNIQINEDLLWN